MHRCQKTTSPRLTVAETTALAFWQIDGPSNEPPVAEVINVHQHRVKSVAWHPLGHMLVRQHCLHRDMMFPHRHIKNTTQY